MHKFSLYLWCVLLTGAIVLGMILIHARPNSYLQIAALGIGQGDSILITTPAKRTILIDGGPGADILTELPKALGPLRDTIDLLIISHPDADHINGLVDVIPRYHIKGILMTDTSSTSLAYQQLQLLIKHHNIPVIPAQAGTRIRIDPEVYIDILFPWASIDTETELDTNNSSIIARLQYGETSMLLMGDAEYPAEELLLRTAQSLQSTILKVGHHGSRTSTNQQLYNAVRPKYSILQYGQNNSYGHPHPEVIDTIQNTEIFSSAQGTAMILCTRYAFCTRQETLSSSTNHAIVDTLFSPPYGALYRYSHLFGVL